jgi:hypothetical protein
MNGDRKKELRTKSMLGTLFFTLGIVGAVLFVITGSVWTGVAAVALLASGVILLYQVGKSLP